MQKQRKSATSFVILTKTDLEPEKRLSKNMAKTGRTRTVKTISYSTGTISIILCVTRSNQSSALSTLHIKQWKTLISHPPSCRFVVVRMVHNFHIQDCRHQTYLPVVKTSTENTNTFQSIIWNWQLKPL